MPNIAETVSMLVKEYEQRFGFTAAEINEGSCWEFAEELYRRLGGEVQSNEALMDHDPGWYHAFFFLDGRYYDSEAPEGVEDWRQLPCCKRCTTST